MQNKDVVDNLGNVTDKYWEATESSFIDGAKSVREQYDIHQKQFKSLLDDEGESRQQITKRIDSLEEQMLLFGGLPWSVPPE